MGNESSKTYEKSDKSKVENLLTKMTLEEKVSQLGSVLPGELLEDGEFSEEKAKEVLSNGIGHITKPGGESGFQPKKTAELVNKIQNFLEEETRLGIPAMVHEECLSGYMGSGGTTYPQIIGLASSWNPSLIEDITAKIKDQIRVLGGHQVLAPVLDVSRDYRWGRVEETFGEDPYLVATMGKSYIDGLQGENPREGISATAKHFCAHGAPEGGRNHCSVNVSDRELRETFLFPFEAAVKKAEIGAIMSAYHDIDGVPCSCSHKLLTEILHEEWDFDGFVISDGHSIKLLHTTHSVAENEKQAGIMALKAGLDLEGPTTECFGEPLIEAVREDLIPEERIDRAVRRHLEAKYSKGLFERKNTGEVANMEDYFGTPEHRDLARRAGRESIVLLKNNNDILPLSKDLESIAVIGPNADSKRNLLGDYAYGGHTENKDISNVTTILDGVKNKVSEETEVYYAEGCKVKGDSREGFDEAINIAKSAEITLIVIGGKSGFGFFPPEGKENNFGQTTGEGNDRTDLNLPGVQRELVKKIHETKSETVAVLINGRPLSVNWSQKNLSAIVESWLPGEEGGNAVSDVLFGDYNPGGKLPVTIPKKVGQLPIYHRRRKVSKERRYVFTDNDPLYPFGFGLSYTDFVYSELEIKPKKAKPDSEIRVSCSVENIGDMVGREVVQLYIQDEFASITRPERELKGFKRITLEPGKSKKISFHLPTDLLGFYGKDMELVVEPGRFKVLIGGSSEDIRLTGEFEVFGEKRFPIQRERSFSTETTVK
ncbi:glycoside hydrolase family 3 C-terminal domain-containing protein [Candidatus Bipolaricaulota bacterium]|nr:glycoside hydrolase family 3 C-terminal domain-containing protein [Candidatus Bipolaricaulota bacterium]